MTDDEWIAAAGKLARQQSRRRGVEDRLRVELAEVALLMLQAPTAISDIYYDLEEGDIVDRALEVHDRVADEHWRWAPDRSSLQAVALDVGARARGLDLALAHDTGDDGPAEDFDTDYFCKPANAYVVPRAPLAWEEGHGSRRFFRRRGTPLHRVIPKQAGSFVQELHRLDGFDFALEADRPLGAAMFEEFTLDYEGDGTTLHILGFRCNGAAAAIDQQVSSAYASGCSAIVWPELTMPASLIGVLARRLEEEAYATGERRGPSWVLGGSWHEGEPTANVAHVIDGYGQPVFEQAKAIPYREAGLGRENMTPAYRVPILVTDRELVAFGICRDFCELGQQTPWSSLNVDLVAVASMGDETTMQSHRTAAHLGSACGQRAFVVQQRAVTGTGATGWVLPPTSKPGALELAGMIQGSWSEHWRD